MLFVQPFEFFPALKAQMEAQASTSGALRGALIVFEGIDRCGKTTQCAKLVEHLQGQGVSLKPYQHHIHAPSGSRLHIAPVSWWALTCWNLRHGLQVDAQLWRFPDRTTDIGSTINDYLANKSNLDDAVIHLLFVANRFEKRWVQAAEGDEVAVLLVGRGVTRWPAHSGEDKAWQ